MLTRVKRLTARFLPHRFRRPTSKKPRGTNSKRSSRGAVLVGTQAGRTLDAATAADGRRRRLLDPDQHVAPRLGAVGHFLDRRPGETGRARPGAPGSPPSRHSRAAGPDAAAARGESSPGWSAPRRRSARGPRSPAAPRPPCSGRRPAVSFSASATLGSDEDLVVATVAILQLDAVPAAMTSISENGRPGARAATRTERLLGHHRVALERHAADDGARTLHDLQHQVDPALVVGGALRHDDILAGRHGDVGEAAEPIGAAHVRHPERRTPPRRRGRHRTPAAAGESLWSAPRGSRPRAPPPTW